MDAHHGNGFAKAFLADDGMAEVLRLLHHPDVYVHREAFRFASALTQQVRALSQTGQKAPK